MSHTITVPSTATTYTANFTTQYQLTTLVSPQGCGNITASPTSSDGFYNAGSSIQLTPTPSSGYSFSGWAGAATGTANPKTISMSEPRSVTATFQLFNSVRSSRMPPSNPGRTIRKRDRVNRGE